MARSYERMEIEAFGQHLLESNDLDPIYVALHGLVRSGKWSATQRDKFLVAYWCFYSAGLACYMSTRDNFYWSEMMRAAENEVPAPHGGRWERGHERRHFRGAQATRAIAELQMKYPNPVEMVIGIQAAALAADSPNINIVFNRVQAHRGFGPWISFKVADMLDRLEIAPVDFDEAHVLMFKDPVEAANRLYVERFASNTEKNIAGKVGGVIRLNREGLRKTVNWVIDQFAPHYTAPPLHERPVGLQEAETILCKWKSHMNGHYPPFNDICEIDETLVLWASEGGCEAAAQFKEMMPRRPE